MKVYITESNANRILRKVDLRKVECKDGEIYKYKLFMFSQYEEHQLLVYKALMKDLEGFIEDVYVPFHLEKQEDTFWWVYEETSNPVYHLSPSCERLNSGYENYKVPVAVRYLGIEDEDGEKRSGRKPLTQEEKEIVKENVRSFRGWFNEFKRYLETDRMDLFLMHLNMHFRLDPPVRSIEAFKQNNSGIEIIENDLNELERKIDLLIKESGRYYYADKKNTTILKRYSKCTYLARKSEPLSGNNTGYDDKTVKEFLWDYDQKFKQPLKALLKEYYRVKYNPDLIMNDNLLNQLGFRVCYNCKLLYSDKETAEQSISNIPKVSKGGINDMPADLLELYKHSIEDPDMLDIQAQVNTEDEYNRIWEEMSGLNVPEEIASDVQDLTRED